MINVNSVNPIYVDLLAVARQTSTLVTLLVELHWPEAIVHAKAPDCGPPHVEWRCRGEEANGEDWEWADWPCETIRIIATNLGAELA